MTSGDRKAFGAALYLLGEVFETPVSELRVEAYFEALVDLPVDAVLLAMKAHVKTATFFPKPGELRAMIEGKADDRAEMGWVEALRLARHVGSYRNPELTDPALRAAIDALGGWRTFCLSEDDLTYRATLFKRTYAAMQRRAEFEREALPAWDAPRSLPPSE